jgi:hypothetical protein
MGGPDFPERFVAGIWKDLVLKNEYRTAYRHTLEGWYSCHKAADKPDLRPQMPERPATTIINFDPNSIWPR